MSGKTLPVTEQDEQLLECPVEDRAVPGPGEKPFHTRRLQLCPVWFCALHSHPDLLQGLSPC